MNDYNDLLEYLYVNNLVDENLNWKENDESEEKEEPKVLIKEKENKNITKK